MTIAYGQQIQTDGVNNQPVGPSSTVADFKDRCQYTGTLNSIDLFRKCDGVAGSYSAGTGGTWGIRVETDDGSGLPSGTLIASGATATGATTSASSAIQRFAFATPISDVFGTLRHFRITNTDASPTVNYVSLNCIDTSESGWNPTPLQPTFLDSDRAFLRDQGSGFAINRARYPILSLNYADGFVAGQSIYDALSGSGQRNINSTSSVRMNFTPTVSPVVVSAASFRVYKQSGTTAALVMNLRDLTGGGTVLATQSFAAASVNLGSTVTGYGARYVRMTFSALLLTVGNNYALSLDSTEATTPYISFPSRRGGSGFGANLVAASRFLDGYWEYTTNSGGAWNLESASQEFQAQAYFEVATRSGMSAVGVGA